MKRNATSFFEFSPDLDRNILADLYGGDTRHTEKVFKDFIKLSGLFLTESAVILGNGTIKNLNPVIHKFKPMLFYTGLKIFYEKFEEFENLCEQTSQTGEIILAYENIKKILIHSREIIDAEINRLTVFNSAAL
jgi:hypothetical protein